MPLLAGSGQVRSGFHHHPHPLPVPLSVVHLHCTLTRNSSLSIMFPSWMWPYKQLLLRISVLTASNIVFMSTKAVLVDFGLSVQMTEDTYLPKDLRGTEVTIHLTVTGTLLRVKEY